MTFTLTPFSNDAPEAQSMLPPAPQLRSGGAGGGAGLESSLFLQVTASDCCSLCAKHHRLEVQQECTGSLGEGTAGPWALCPDTYGHTSSDQEESNGKQASQPGKTDLSRYGNLPRGPQETQRRCPGQHGPGESKPAGFQVPPEQLPPSPAGEQCFLCSR